MKVKTAIVDMPAGHWEAVENLAVDFDVTEDLIIQWAVRNYVVNIGEADPHEPQYAHLVDTPERLARRRKKEELLLNLQELDWPSINAT